ncbi:hypothetical protein OROHE_011484 [Orobanche hederae]
MAKRGLRSLGEGEGFFSKRKVCVVTHGEGKPYTLFFMDLDMNANNSCDFIDTKPAIEIVYPIDAYFSESNSNLYMFHANRRLLPSRFKNLKGSPVYKIDLSSSSSSSSSSSIWGPDSVITLNPGLGVEGMKGVLIPYPEMKTSKRLFDISRAPDGRIIAFSRNIHYFRSTDEYQLYKDVGDFIIGSVFHVVVYMGAVKKGFYLNIDDLQGGWRVSPAQIAAPKFCEEPFLQRIFILL